MIKITNEVYFLESSNKFNVFLIKGENNILIDTGFPGDAKKILDEIKDIDLDYILITHHDIDHIGNLVEIQEAKNCEVYAPSKDIPYMTGEKSRPGIKRLLSKKLKKVPKSENLKELPDEISNVIVIKTPGHTPGHVCFLYDNVIFLGDLFRNEGVIELINSKMNDDEDLIRESIPKIFEYDIKYFAPTHGEIFEFSPKVKEDILNL
ncbi:MAG: MBL fold metallo-hydrolase [Methanobacteriaceae archaeon]|nr:MBL fold metallo-hydrolase [Methanobacteriaceae archaeon]